MIFNSINDIFSVDKHSIDECCLQVFKFQYENCKVYRNWCDLISKTPSNVSIAGDIPFLPISFFKTHHIRTSDFEAEVMFESSGTTQLTTSRHFVKDVSVYEQSFLQCFRQFYGEPHEYCILALLPSYLERGNSSLVYMVDKLIQLSGNQQSGFYLYEHEQLHRTLTELEAAGQKIVLFGVTYALIDFAESFPIELHNTTIIETGGMKGRKKELTRQEVHAILHKQLGGAKIHSEYGMTELLSQAYSTNGGIFYCPAWMKVLVREEDDPFLVKRKGRGVINVIDLANVYSCSFIATDDAGNLYDDGSFEVLGRVDNSDIRGCSLLAL